MGDTSTLYGVEYGIWFCRVDARQSRTLVSAVRYTPPNQHGLVAISHA